MVIINIELYSIGFDATFQHEELRTMSKCARRAEGNRKRDDSSLSKLNLVLSAERTNIIGIDILIIHAKDRRMGKSVFKSRRLIYPYAFYTN